MKSIFKRPTIASMPISRAKPKKLSYSSSKSDLSKTIRTASIPWPDAPAIYKYLYSRVEVDDDVIEEREDEDCDE